MSSIHRSSDDEEAENSGKRLWYRSASLSNLFKDLDRHYEQKRIPGFKLVRHSAVSNELTTNVSKDVAQGLVNKLCVTARNLLEDNQRLFPCNLSDAVTTLNEEEKHLFEGPNSNNEGAFVCVSSIQEDAESSPSFQDAESSPSFQDAESSPSFQDADLVEEKQTLAKSVGKRLINYNEKQNTLKNVASAHSSGQLSRAHALVKKRKL